MKVAIYLRVSTGEQDIGLQRRELTEIAQRRGWTITSEYVDHGVSGAKGRDQRPGLDQLLKDAARGKFDLVAAWSVDRVGRSTVDLLHFLQQLQAQNVAVYFCKQGFDASTPEGRLMFGLLSLFAAFEREMIQTRVKAGLAKAKANGTKSGRAIGRPALSDEKIAAVRNALAAKMTLREAAAACGVSRGFVHNIAKSQ
jgi:DNA invertase Pin-like site-specific DNA recombinase